MPSRRDLTLLFAGQGASAPEAPVNTTLPAITGTAQEGETLTYVPGTWTGTPVLTLTWEADGTPIAGETDTTLLLTATEVGAVITVTEHDSVSGTSATSDATDAVLPNLKPVASFTWVDNGDATVTFTDTSTNSPTAWAWTFGDGIGSSTDQNPTYDYGTGGTELLVTLTAENAYGSDDASESVAVVFAPNQIAGLELWYDADDDATLFQDAAGTTPATADGDPIGQWADKSNNRHATQATAGVLPTLKTGANGINGKSVVLPDAGDTLGLSIALDAGSFTVYTVTLPSAALIAATGGYLLDSLTGRLILGTQNGKLTFYDGAFHTENDLLTEAACIIRWRLTSGGNGQIFKDGALTFEAAYTAKAIGGTTRILNKYNADTNSWRSSVGEILLYSGAHTDPQAAAVESYLAEKWGITLAAFSAPLGAITSLGVLLQSSNLRNMVAFDDDL